MAKVVKNQEDINKAEKNVDLPAKGAARNEVLAQRKDELQEAAEKLGEDVLVIDPKVFERDREIQYLLDRDGMDIPVPPEYKVMWVNYRNERGQTVWKMKRRGWVALTKDMIKSGGVDPSMVCADGTIRCGDVMAMIMPTSRYEHLVQKNEEKALRQQGKLRGELEYLGKHHRDALRIHDLSDDSDPYASQLRKAARKTAINHMGNRMKEGFIDGVPLR